MPHGAWGLSRTRCRLRLTDPLAPLWADASATTGYTRLSLQTLMHADADELMEDDMGNTAFSLAQAGDHQDIMTALSISGYLLRSVARLFGAKA